MAKWVLVAIPLAIFQHGWQICQLSKKIPMKEVGHVLGFNTRLQSSCGRKSISTSALTGMVFV